MNDGRRRELTLYVSGNGTEVVEKEIKKAKLSKGESGRFDEVVERAESGKLRSGDVKHLRGEIFELRVRGDRRVFRLLYASVSDGGVVLLGLLFFNKKTDRCPPEKIDLAIERLAEYRTQSEPEP